MFVAAMQSFQKEENILFLVEVNFSLLLLNKRVFLFVLLHIKEVVWMVNFDFFRFGLRKGCHSDVESGYSLYSTDSDDQVIKLVFNTVISVI